jgi:hypothetical protein
MKRGNWRILTRDLLSISDIPHALVDFTPQARKCALVYKTESPREGCKGS